MEHATVKAARAIDDGKALNEAFDWTKEIKLIPEDDIGLSLVPGKGKNPYLMQCRAPFIALTLQATPVGRLRALRVNSVLLQLQHAAGHLSYEEGDELLRNFWYLAMELTWKEEVVKTAAAQARDGNDNQDNDHLNMNNDEDEMSLLPHGVRVAMRRAMPSGYYPKTGKNLLGPAKLLGWHPYDMLAQRLLLGSHLMKALYIAYNMFGGGKLPSSLEWDFACEGPANTQHECPNRDDAYVCIASERGGFFGGKPFCNTCHRSIDRADWDLLRELIEAGMPLTPARQTLYNILEKTFDRNSELNGAYKRNKPQKETRTGRTGVPQGARRYTEEIDEYPDDLLDQMAKVLRKYIELSRKKRISIVTAGQVLDLVLIHEWTKRFPNEELKYPEGK